MFVGNAKHQIDEKGRIRIPTKFRDELGANPFIMKGPNSCLCIYPEVTAKTKFLENSAMWISVTAKACVL